MVSKTLERLTEQSWFLEYDGHRYRFKTEPSINKIIADEAIQNLSELEFCKDIYSGVNIKLMKAGGIRNALKLMQRAKDLNMKVMIGCMTETSCAITAASHLTPLANWVDLDGAELILNDLFIDISG